MQLLELRAEFPGMIGIWPLIKLVTRNNCLPPRAQSKTESIYLKEGFGCSCNETTAVQRDVTGAYHLLCTLNGTKRGPAEPRIKT